MRMMLYEVRFSIWMVCKALDGESVFNSMQVVCSCYAARKLFFQLASTSAIDSSETSSGNAMNNCSL
jgi:hypothetical protein